MRIKISFVLILIITLSTVNAGIKYYWQKNGVKVTEMQGFYLYEDFDIYKATSDEFGNMIFTWNESPGNLIFYIYSQKVSSEGEVLWDIRGKPVCTIDAYNNLVIIEKDYENGAYYYWDGNNNFYLQRLNAEGEPLWGDNGFPINALHLQMKSIKNEGLFITYEKVPKAYVDKLDENGESLWGEIPLAPDFNERQMYPKIYSDNNFIYVFWSDYRNGDKPDCYGQKLDFNGLYYWELNGKLFKDYSSIASFDNDGNFYLLISIQDNKGRHFHGVQKFNSEDGEPIWNEPVAFTYEYIPTDILLIPNPEGGCFVVYFYWDSNNLRRLKAQKISPDGELLWDEDGVDACLKCPDIYSGIQQAIDDGNGGLFIFWLQLINFQYSKIRAQHISSDGERLWNDKGEIICCDFDNFVYPPQISPSIDNTVIVVWYDEREEHNWNFYAQRIGDEPDTPTPVPTLTPTPTVEPTPTLPILLNLNLNQTTFKAKDDFILSIYLKNQTENKVEGKFYLILECFSNYYYFPSWSEVPEGLMVEIPESIEAQGNIIETKLPDPLEVKGTFTFYTAIIDPKTYQLLSNLDSITFSIE